VRRAARAARPDTTHETPGTHDRRGADSMAREILVPMKGGGRICATGWAEASRATPADTGGAPRTTRAICAQRVQLPMFARIRDMEGAMAPMTGGLLRQAGTRATIRRGRPRRATRWLGGWHTTSRRLVARWPAGWPTMSRLARVILMEGRRGTGATGATAVSARARISGRPAHPDTTIEMGTADSRGGSPWARRGARQAGTMTSVIRSVLSRLKGARAAATTT
jgi:hypothetical protein